MKTVLLLALLASVSANFEEEVSSDRFGVPLSCPSGFCGRGTWNNGARLLLYLRRTQRDDVALRDKKRGVKRFD